MSSFSGFSINNRIRLNKGKVKIDNVGFKTLRMRVSGGMCVVGHTHDGTCEGSAVSYGHIVSYIPFIG